MKKTKNSSPRNPAGGGARALTIVPASPHALEGHGVHRNYAYCRLLEVGISEPTALRVSKDVEMVSFAAGEAIWKKGAPIDAWAYVVSGLVVSSLQPDDGKSGAIEIFSESSWFGDHQILSDAVAEADYVCLEQTNVLLMSRSQVLELMESELEFARFLTRLMAWRSQTQFEFLAVIRMGNPCFKTVAGLWRVALALTNAFEHRASGIPVDSVLIPLRQDVLAALCGVSRTVFSKYVNRLAAAGWLRRSYGALMLVNAPAWERLQQLQRLRQTSDYSPTIDDLLKDFDSVAGL